MCQTGSSSSVLGPFCIHCKCFVFDLSNCTGPLRGLFVIHKLVRKMTVFADFLKILCSRYFVVKRPVQCKVLCKGISLCVCWVLSSDRPAVIYTDGEYENGNGNWGAVVIIPQLGINAIHWGTLIAMNFPILQHCISLTKRLHVFASSQAPALYVWEKRGDRRHDLLTWNSYQTHDLCLCGFTPTQLR